MRNTIDMLLHIKAVKFFYLYENHMTYKNPRVLDDLKKLLSEYCNEHLSQAEMDEILSCKGVLPGSDPAWIKYQKKPVTHGNKSRSRFLANKKELQIVLF